MKGVREGGSESATSRKRKKIPTKSNAKLSTKWKVQKKQKTQQTKKKKSPKNTTR